MHYATRYPINPAARYFAHWCDVLFPIGTGRRKRLLAMLDNRVTWREVQHWFAGKRPLPQWALACLERTLARAKEKGR